MIVDQTLAAPALETVILGLGKSAVARLADGEHQTALADDAHADDLVALFESERLDAAGKSAHRTDVVLIEADRDAELCLDNHIGVAFGHAHPGKLVALVELKRDQTALARGVIGIECNALDDTLARDHDEEFVLVKLGHADHGADLFIGRDGKQVGDIDAL